MTYYIWHQNCFSKWYMTPPDEKLFFKLIDDIEDSDGLTEEDEDLMRKLAMKVAEIECKVEDSD